jgi:hypothetical protein
MDPTKDRKPMKGTGAVLVAAGLVLVSVAVVWGVPHVGAASDDYGNTAQTAKPVFLNRAVSGVINSRQDRDWFVLPPLNGQPARVTIMGDGFPLRRAVFDGDLRQVATAPGPTALSMGPTAYDLPLPPGVSDPVRMQVTPAGGAIGAYSFTVQGSTGGGLPPPVPPPPPPADPLPPPPPPMDDVPAGQTRTISASTGAADGRLESAGDSDTYEYTATLAGDYTFRLTSTEAPDAVADVLASSGGEQIAAWFTAPTTIPMNHGETARLIVRSLGGEGIGAYHVEIVSPVAPPPPPPPPSGDVALAFNVTTDSLQKASRLYAAWEYSTFRFRDAASVNSELIAAMAVHDRWIARSKDGRVRPAAQDSNGALDASIRRLGSNASVMARTFATFAQGLSQSATLGGGDSATVVATVRQGLEAGRPVLVAGRRGDGLLKLWVVYGLETVGDVVMLRGLDPSIPGRMSDLTVQAEGGIAPVQAGNALLSQFAFAGFDKDTLP